MEGGGAVNVLARLEEGFFDTVLADFLISNASKQQRCSTVYPCLGNVGANHLESVIPKGITADSLFSWDHGSNESSGLCPESVAGLCFH